MKELSPSCKNVDKRKIKQYELTVICYVAVRELKTLNMEKQLLRCTVVNQFGWMGMGGREWDNSPYLLDINKDASYLLNIGIFFIETICAC